MWRVDFASQGNAAASYRADNLSGYGIAENLISLLKTLFAKRGFSWPAFSMYRNFVTV